MPSLGAGEGLVIVGGALVALTPLFIWLGLFLWARAVAKKHGEKSAFRFAPWLPVAGIVTHLGGFALSSILLALAFSNVASSPPERRSEVLAASISESMNCAAFGIVCGALFGVASLVACVAGQLRKPS